MSAWGRAFLFVKYVTLELVMAGLSEVLKVRVTPEMLAQLETLAAEMDTSVSWAARRLIKAGLNRRERGERGEEKAGGDQAE